MRKLLLFFFCFLWLLSGFAQVKIDSVKADRFPDVTIWFKSNNPEEQKVKIYEDGTLIDSIKDDTIIKPSIQVKKNVLFLWDLRSKESFVPELLSDLFSGMQMSSQSNDSLKVNVSVFRRDEDGNPLYSPLVDSFTSDLEEMGEQTIKESQKELTDNSSLSDIVWALEQAINQLKSLPDNEAKAIVLFTVGQNNFSSGLEITPTIKKAKDNRILIYVVNIDGDEAAKNLSLNLSSRSYGLCHFSNSESSFKTKDSIRNPENQRAIDENKGNPLPYPFLFEENDIINTWVNELPKRWVGNVYGVTFKSHFDRIGQTKEIKVELGDETGIESYDVPKYTFGNWIKDHLVLFIILLVVVVAGIATGSFFLVRYLRDVAADKREEKQKQEEERKRLKSEQENLRRKLEIAENEKRKQQEKEKSKEKAAQRQEQLDALNSLMRSRNIRVRLLVSTMTGSSEYMVTTAENTIGSADDNDIVIVDQTVSRHHALLYFDGQSFGIRDLRSTNGIMMNGFKINDVKLRNGDSVSLGKVVMKIYF